MFKNYLIQNLLLTFLLGGLAGIVYKTALHGYYTVFVPVALVLSLAINLGGYQMALRKKNVDKQLLVILIQSFSLRFFTYIALVVIFLLRTPDHAIRLCFVCALFVMYVLYTLVEVRGMASMLHGKSTSGKS